MHGYSMYLGKPLPRMLLREKGLIKNRRGSGDGLAGASPKHVKTLASGKTFTVVVAVGWLYPSNTG